jgi:hypothetical protein
VTNKRRNTRTTTATAESTTIFGESDETSGRQPSTDKPEQDPSRETDMENNEQN